jgi:hypothetical protein
VFKTASLDRVCDVVEMATHLHAALANRPLAHEGFIPPFGFGSTWLAPTAAIVLGVGRLIGSMSLEFNLGGQAYDKKGPVRFGNAIACPQGGSYWREHKRKPTCVDSQGKSTEPSTMLRVWQWGSGGLSFGAVAAASLAAHLLERRKTMRGVTKNLRARAARSSSMETMPFR